MLGTVKTSRSHIGAQYIVKIFLCQPFVKEFAKKERGFCIVLKALFNHEGHESNKKLAGGGKPNPYFQNRNNSDTTDYGSAFGGTTDHLEES